MPTSSSACTRCLPPLALVGHAEVAYAAEEDDNHGGEEEEEESREEGDGRVRVSEDGVSQQSILRVWGRKVLQSGRVFSKHPRVLVWKTETPYTTTHTKLRILLVCKRANYFQIVSLSMQC